MAVAVLLRGGTLHHLQPASLLPFFQSSNGRVGRTGISSPAAAAFQEEPGQEVRTVLFNRKHILVYYNSRKKRASVEAKEDNKTSPGRGRGLVS